MKWTTANVKNPNYTNNHEIYVGTETGTFKKLVPYYAENPFKQTNLQNLDELDKTSHITALAFGNEQKSEILVGRRKSIVNVHSVETEHAQYTIDFGESPVVGLARFNDRVVAGFGNGHIKCVVLNNEGDIDQDQAGVYLNKVGDDMAHLRQCPTQRNFVAVGGKGRQNNLKVFDMAEEGKQVFSSKNLPNDFLQLEVPVWDSDVGFLGAPHSIATCSRQGYVRVYDTRKQRRPVQCYATEEQMSFTSLVVNGNFIYTGTTTGALKAFDIRRMKTFVHTYKGFTGGITDLCLDTSGKYLTSACLDRYVRVHNVDSCFLMYQCYVKSKASRVLLRESLEIQDSDKNDREVDKEEGEGLSKKVKSQKNKRGQGDLLSEDEEYEDMFENMQTIRDEENVDEEVSISEDEAQAEADAEAEIEEHTALDTVAVADKTSKKRKSNSKSVTNKRKKGKQLSKEQ